MDYRMHQAAESRRLRRQPAWQQELVTEGASLDALEIMELERWLERTAETLRRRAALRRSASRRRRC